MRDTGGVYVSGEVLETTFRNGVTNGREWSFTSVRVLTGADVTEVSWDPKNSEGECPRTGDRVNLEVQLRGARVSAKRHASPVAAVKSA